jgi:serine/threonine protein kinase
MSGSDRDLMLGLLALRVNLVAGEVMAEALAAPHDERAPPLGERLCACGALAEADRALLEALIERHIAAHGGDVRRSLAALVLPATLPEALQRIVAESDGATLDADADPPIEATIAAEGAVADLTWTLSVPAADPERYRIVRPHAQGGIGRVLVALDTELNREVALKQIKPELADDPASRARFLLEAEITGRLEHPGVVPVYGLGRDARGRPYYAMRFVRGESLRKAIDTFHADDAGSRRRHPDRELAFRKLLARFVEVCNAVAYAHSRGVIHRDIKPANILLGPYGETLLVDWGLAKVIGRGAPGDATPEAEARRIEPGAVLADEATLRVENHAGSGETLAGTAIGTPGYMSPEQAAGDLRRIGPASDVYSLGATLYCLATGRSPFEEREVASMLRRAQAAEFPPPRQIQGRVPRALEAIILKAMARRPEDRYGSARALVEDVELWLADAPLSAYRESWPARLLRWLTRHRVAVTALGAAGLVALAGLMVVLVLEAAANVRLARSRAQVEQANDEHLRQIQKLNAAQARAERLLDLARDAIRSFHSGVSEDVLLKEPQLEGLRKRLLDAASEFYRKLQDELKGDPDPEARSELADSLVSLADLSAAVGSKTEALDALDRAGAIRSTLLSDKPEAVQHVIASARIRQRVGALLEQTGEPEEAERAYGEAVAWLRRVSEAHPDDVAIQDALAFAWGDLAQFYRRRGRHDEARDAQERVVTIREGLVEAAPGDARLRHELAWAYANTGAIWNRPGTEGRALDFFEHAGAIEDALCRQHPEDSTFARSAAWFRKDIGHALGSQGRRDEARAAFEQAAARLETLHAREPADLDLTDRLAQTANTLGTLLRAMEQPEASLRWFERERAAREELVVLMPTSTRARHELARADLDLAARETALRGPSASVPTLERVRNLLDGLVRDNPSVVAYQAERRRALAMLGEAYRRVGRRGDALAALEAWGQALANLDAEPSPDEEPGLAEQLAALAVEAHEAGRDALALRAAGLAAERWEALLAKHPDRAAAEGSRLVNALALHGGLLARTGQLDAARERLARAEHLRARVGRPDPDALYNLACGYGLLAGRLADPAERRALGDRALALLREAIDRGYRPGRLRDDPDLEPFRDRADFQALERDAGFPSSPFAGADR